MKNISIYKEFGDTCVNGSSAKSFASKKIVPFLSKGMSVAIDFKGVEMASSSFINSIIFNTYGYGIVKNQVRYKSDDKIISSMINNAIKRLEKLPQ